MCSFSRSNRNNKKNNIWANKSKIGNKLRGIFQAGNYFLLCTYKIGVSWEDWTKNNIIIKCIATDLKLWPLRDEYGVYNKEGRENKAENVFA